MREQEGTRERGIITTITLPPWDRSREEEKGKQNEKEDGEEDEEDEDVVWWSRTRKKERHRERGGILRFAHGGYIYIYLVLT